MEFQFRLVKLSKLSLKYFQMDMIFLLQHITYQIREGLDFEMTNP